MVCKQVAKEIEYIKLSNYCCNIVALNKCSFMNLNYLSYNGNFTLLTCQSKQATDPIMKGIV